MTRENLLKALRQLQQSNDPEVAHGDADDLLLDYLNDDEIKAAFYKIERWYA